MSKYNFSVVCKTHTNKRGMCSISFYLPRSLRINRSVINALGKPNAIRILYDLERNVIAVQKADESNTDAFSVPTKTRVLSYTNDTFFDLISHNGWTENMHVEAADIENDMIIFNLSTAAKCSMITPKKLDQSKSSKPDYEPDANNPPFSSLKPRFIDVVSKAQSQ